MQGSRWQRSCVCVCVCVQVREKKNKTCPLMWCSGVCGWWPRYERHRLDPSTSGGALAPPGANQWSLTCVKHRTRFQNDAYKEIRFPQRVVSRVGQLLKSGDTFFLVAVVVGSIPALVWLFVMLSHHQSFIIIWLIWILMFAAVDGP